MKAVAAVLLTAGVTPAGLAVSGVLMGLVLLVLGATGWINRLGRLIPQSVLAGLQLGLGIALAIGSIKLMATAPAIGGVTLALLLGLLWIPRAPAAPLALGLATILAVAFDLPASTVAAIPWMGIHFPPAPTMAELEHSIALVVLPQLALTLTNAVLLTALIAGDYFGDRAAHVTPARLSITSGLANLLLTPFGALPMCHGAGGLAAHYRFGARTGTAPLLLGLGLLVFALLPNGAGPAILAAIPVAGLGALLLVASGELAFTRRLFDSRVSCWPVIAATGGATAYLDPFWGLMTGLTAEAVRVFIFRGSRHKIEADW